MEKNPNADTNCPECHGYGYLLVDEELLTLQSNEHRVEERWVPIYSHCHCTDSTTTELIKDEAVIRSHQRRDEF